jgi:hypothetical protein
MPDEPDRDRDHRLGSRRLSDQEMSLSTQKEYFESKLADAEKFLAEHERHYVDLLAERDRRYALEFDALDKRRQASVDAIEKAVDKAAVAQEHSDAKNNEFRAQLTEERATYATKSEVKQQYDAMMLQNDKQFAGLEKTAEINRTDIAALREFRSAAAGNELRAAAAKSEHNWSLGVIVSIVTAAAAALLSVATIMLRK